MPGNSELTRARSVAFRAGGFGALAFGILFGYVQSGDEAKILYTPPSAIAGKPPAEPLPKSTVEPHKAFYMDLFASNPAEARNVAMNFFGRLEFQNVTARCHPGVRYVFMREIEGKAEKVVIDNPFLIEKKPSSNTSTDQPEYYYVGRDETGEIVVLEWGTGKDDYNVVMERLDMVDQNNEPRDCVVQEDLQITYWQSTPNGALPAHDWLNVVFNPDPGVTGRQLITV
jgi:hypothetical protein